MTYFAADSSNAGFLTWLTHGVRRARRHYIWVVILVLFALAFLAWRGVWKPVEEDMDLVGGKAHLSEEFTILGGAGAYTPFFEIETNFGSAEEAVSALQRIKTAAFALDAKTSRQVRSMRATGSECDIVGSRQFRCGFPTNRPISLRPGAGVQLDVSVTNWPDEFASSEIVFGFEPSPLRTTGWVFIRDVSLTLLFIGYAMLALLELLLSRLLRQEPPRE